MNAETNLQNKIRKGISDIAVTFRGNVVTYKINGRYVKSGLPTGFPDIFGYRRSDKKFIVIEVKRSGKKRSYEQIQMGEVFINEGVLYGVARSIEDARKIVLGQWKSEWN